MPERLPVLENRVELTFALIPRCATSEAPEPRPGRLARHPRSAQSVLVRVPNVAEHYEQAKGSGAHILKEPADFPYGERQYSAIDLGGHVWTFSESLADLAPEAWGGVSAPSGVERGR